MPPPPGGGGYAAPPVGGLPLGGPPDNKLVWSILVTLFCCLPFGVVAIIKSADVNTKWNAGDAAGAQLAAAEAGKWIKWSVIAGCRWIFGKGRPDATVRATDGSQD